MTFETNPFAYIYCRVAISDVRQSRRVCDDQERKCRAYAVRHGLDVLGVFTDYASDMRSDLPEFAAMVDRLEPGMTIIVADLARLQRSPIVSIEARRSLSAAGCGLRLVSDDRGSRTGALPTDAAPRMFDGWGQL